jgi:hypothetical protein
MPKESIGDFGDGQLPREQVWVSACYEFATAHLKRVCGEPPTGYTLENIYHEYESISGDIIPVPSLGITWEGRTEAPWGYIEKCQIALQILTDAIDWSAIQPENVQEEFPEEEDDDDDWDED